MARQKKVVTPKKVTERKTAKKSKVFKKAVPQEEPVMGNIVEKPKTEFYRGLQIIKKGKKEVNGITYNEIMCEDRTTYLLLDQELK